MTVAIKTFGLKSFITKVEKGKRELKSMSGTHKAAAVLLRQWILQNFDAAGTKHRSPKLHWQPLSESTISGRRKGRKSGVPQILRDTGRLRRDWIIGGTNKFGFVQSAVGYSSTHEFGEGIIPQRKIFPEDDQLLRIVRPAYEKKAMKAVKGL